MKKIISLSLAAVLAFSAAALPVPYADKPPAAITAVADNALGTPKNLRYSVSSKGKIKLEWDKVKDADGYVVYKYDTSARRWKSFKSIRSCSLTVSGIKGDQKYFFKVAALKNLNGKYYRYGFSDYITVKITGGIGYDSNSSADNQQSMLVDYYKDSLAVSGKNLMHAKSSRAYIANALSPGGTVLLADFYFENDKKITCAYCIYNGTVTPIGNGIIADSDNINMTSAYFVKEETSGSVYIMITNNYSNSSEEVIAKVTPQGLLPVYKFYSLYDAIYYLNDEPTDYGTYLTIMDSFSRCEGKDDDEEIVIIE